MNSALFETYLPEFMWRKRFGGPSIWEYTEAHRTALPCIAISYVALYFIVKSSIHLIVRGKCTR